MLPGGLRDRSCAGNWRTPSIIAIVSGEHRYRQGDVAIDSAPDSAAPRSSSRSCRGERVSAQGASRSVPRRNWRTPFIITIVSGSRFCQGGFAIDLAPETGALVHHHDRVGKQVLPGGLRDRFRAETGALVHHHDRVGSSFCHGGFAIDSAPRLAHSSIITIVSEHRYRQGDVAIDSAPDLAHPVHHRDRVGAPIAPGGLGDRFRAEFWRTYLRENPAQGLIDRSCLLGVTGASEPRSLGDNSHIGRCQRRAADATRESRPAVRVAFASQGASCDPSPTRDAGGVPAAQLRPDHHSVAISQTGHFICRPSATGPFRSPDRRTPAGRYPPECAGGR